MRTPVFALVLALSCAPVMGQDLIFSDDFESSHLTVWTAAGCGLGSVVNETGLSSEVDYCVLQWPPTLIAQPGSQSDPIYGQLYEAGLTEPYGPAPGVEAELVWGPDGTSAIHPADRCLWHTIAATYNAQIGNNDEYVASIDAPAQAGSYAYAFRFSLDGVDWTYCDTDGSGSNPDLSYSSALQGALTVAP